MMKYLLMVILACLSGAGFARELAYVSIEYAERDGPQGSYILMAGEDGRFSLKPISGDLNLPEVKMSEIVPTLEKAYPFLAGMITADSFDAKTDELTKTGEVQIFGQIKRPGRYPADTLGACITKAEPTEFGSIKRIQVINGGKSAVYDITRKEFLEIKLEPGAIVFVPMKRVIGK